MRNLHGMQFHQLITELCIVRQTTEPAPDRLPMPEQHFQIYRTMRDREILEEVDFARLEPGTIDACGDDRRFWEGMDHIREKTIEFGPHKPMPFPLADPGGSVLAHPKIAQAIRIDTDEIKALNIRLTYVARGRNVYYDFRHLPCGVAGILELSPEELVKQSLELGEWLTRELAAEIPGFVAHSMLHVDRYGYYSDSNDWMRHYRVHPGRFSLWEMKGFPLL